MSYEFMVVGVISNIAKSYHASLSTVGLLVTFFAITYAVCTPVLTTVTSKYNRFKVLMAMLVIFWIDNTMTALAPNLFWLFVARIITAAVAGVIISLILVFVSVIAPLEKRSILVAAVFSGFSTATIIGGAGRDHHQHALVLAHQLSGDLGADDHHRCRPLLAGSA